MDKATTWRRFREGAQPRFGLSRPTRGWRKLIRAGKAAVSIATASVGDTGTLASISPKFINGALVKIENVRRTKFEVSFVSGTAKQEQRLAYGRVVIPASSFVRSA